MGEAREGDPSVHPGHLWVTDRNSDSAPPASMAWLVVHVQADERQRRGPTCAEHLAKTLCSRCLGSVTVNPKEPQARGVLQDPSPHAREEGTAQETLVLPRCPAVCKPGDGAHTLASTCEANASCPPSRWPISLGSGWGGGFTYSWYRLLALCL